MIITLGRYSLARYFPGESISKVHGKARKVGGIICYPMYHPAAALHQGRLRQIIEADMLHIPRVLSQGERISETAVESQQLGLL